MNFLVMILDPIKEVYYRFAALFPNLVAMMVIILAGTVIAIILRSVLLKLLNAFNFNARSDQIGFTSMLRKCDVWARPSDAVASFMFFTLLVMSFLGGLTALRITFVDAIIAGIMGYLPRAVSAVFILVFGYIIMGLIAQALLIFLVNNGISCARHWVRAVRALLIMLIAAMALEQLRVAPGIVLAAFSIIFGGSVLALAISFGVAGIDMAKRMLQNRENKKQEEQANDLQHI